MPSARLAHNPSASIAIFIRLAAALATLAMIVVIPLTFASAAIGHLGLASAFETAGVAVALAVLTTLAARSVDPLRR